MAMSQAKREANKRWNDAHLKERYERISMLVPKGRKRQIERYAREHGQTINGWLNALVRAEMGLSEADWKRLEEDREVEVGAPTGNVNAEKQFGHFDQIESRRETKDGTAGQIGKEVGMGEKNVRRAGAVRLIELT